MSEEREPNNDASPGTNRPNPIVFWLRTLRAPFFQAVIVPCILGTVVAWYQTGKFHLGYFLLSFVAVICVHAGTNLTNDYFDHKSGADDINENFNQFSGGSRMIQDGLIAPRKILLVALFSFGVACLIGLYLVYACGWPLLAIGAVGIFSGYFYTASPFKIGYRGWGELLTGLNCGPLVVLGAYYVHAQSLSWRAVTASLPVGFLIAAVLYINQFPDYEADKAAGKANLVVKLGPQRAVKGFYFLLVGAYSAIVLGCVWRVLPVPALIALLSLPFAWKAATLLRVAYAGGRKLVPAMASTVATHLATGVLLACGYWLAGVLK